MTPGRGCVRTTARRGGTTGRTPASASASRSRASRRSKAWSVIPQLPSAGGSATARGATGHPTGLSPSRDRSPWSRTPRHDAARAGSVVDVQAPERVTQVQQPRGPRGVVAIRARVGDLDLDYGEAPAQRFDAPRSPRPRRARADATRPRSVRSFRQTIGQGSLDSILSEAGVAAADDHAHLRHVAVMARDDPFEGGHIPGRGCSHGRRRDVVDGPECACHPLTDAAAGRSVSGRCRASHGHSLGRHPPLGVEHQPERCAVERVTVPIHEAPPHPRRLRHPHDAISSAWAPPRPGHPTGATAPRTSIVTRRISSPRARAIPIHQLMHVRCQCPTGRRASRPLTPSEPPSATIGSDWSGMPMEARWSSARS